MIASVRLNRLHCNAENASEGATPYAWVEILAINDDTLRSSALVAGVGFVPAPLGAQLVIQNGMRAGDNASVPEALQRFDAAGLEAAEYPGVDGSLGRGGFRS
jgi:hypothetical protein